MAPAGTELVTVTEAERARLINEWFRAHQAEWDAYLARPSAEIVANRRKIEAAHQAGGMLAARCMATALGMPRLPDELCDPVDALEASRADGDRWVYQVAAQLALSEAEIEEMLRLAPVGQVTTDMPNAGWTAWLARPTAEREAIQDKVQAAFEAHGIQAGRDMMEANQMPTLPPDRVILAAVLDAQREAAGKQDNDPFAPIRRTDH